METKPPSLNKTAEQFLILGRWGGVNSANTYSMELGTLIIEGFLNSCWLPNFLYV